tara:strand:+ start:6563 stop:7612 length:1050 start_codon:yes stop_codon:yes gene_type:complete
MDDYNISSLQESNNEWVSRLVSILTPCIISGCNSIYKEAYQLCIDNEEEDKYLMTFQNFLSRIPKWNTEIVAKEVERITNTSGCDYLEDLITCVHVIQLKALTCIRVGMEHRAIDIEIPKLDAFIHKTYILLARKLYTNIYLYEENIAPLDQQRNNREMEIMVRECILEAVRESIPIESILKAYLDKTVEENVETVVTTLSEPEPASVAEPEQSHQTAGGEGNITATAETSESTPVEGAGDITTTTSFTEPVANVTPQTPMPWDSIPQASPSSPEPSKQLTFSNIDRAQGVDKLVENVHAPKDVTTLERISNENHARRLLEEAEGDDDMEESLNISSEDANIHLDIETL